jgi:iron complex outermembrane recepter protein
MSSPFANAIGKTASARLALLLTTLFPGLVLAGAQPGAAPNLVDLSLEQLVDIEVTIVSKEEEPLAQAAAALTVLTGDDIHRNGATSIPQSLSLVPGLHVSHVSSNIWEVSSRGFSSASSAKLLVLIDGRSVYTPLFSGVFWDVQDTYLEDIDRIEVIRGPGAAVWGANAMNGVINIRTRSAKDTQGSNLEVGAGSEERGFAGLRFGGHIGEHFFYRIYAKIFERDAGFTTSGPSNDSWHMARLGFRTDSELSTRDELTVQGDGYLGNVAQVVPSLALTGKPTPMGNLSADVAGGNVLASWTHHFGKRADFTVRAYWDRTYRNDPTYIDNLDTFDVDLQNGIRLPLQELVWGLSYRMMDDRFKDKGIAALLPPTSIDSLYSGFVQDTLSVVHKALRITAGAKLEHNDFSGFEIQPSVRIAGDPSRRQTLWVAVSRPVRVPTRLERDIFAEVNLSPDALLRLVGNRSLRAEKLIAAELGYRLQPSSRLFFDVAGFYYYYYDLITFEYGTPAMENGVTVQPVLDKNSMHGQAWGGEAAITWTPLDAWKLIANYSYLQLEITPDGMDPTKGQAIEGASPRHQLSVRSMVNLPLGFRFDAFARWVDGLRNASVGAPDTPSYVTADARIAWQGWKHLEISLVGQNLLQSHHVEFPGGTQVERSIYAKLNAWF